MIVSKILIPAQLSIPSLAAALGEFPKVLLQTCTGHWPTLPRVAQRLDELGDLLVARGALVRKSAGEWLAIPQREDVPQHLIPDVVTQKVIPGSYHNRLYADWHRDHPAFTLAAFMSAYQYASSRMIEISRMLEQQGMFSRRERVGEVRTIVWRWNPMHFVMPNGRVPLNMPSATSAPPGRPDLRPTKAESENPVPMNEVIDSFVRDVVAYLEKNSGEPFKLETLTQAISLDTAKFGQARTAQGLKILLRELGWGYNNGRHHWELQDTED